MDASIANLGPRYSRELNFKLDFLPTVFDGLSRNEKFRAAFEFELDKFLKKLGKVAGDILVSQETAHFSQLFIDYASQLRNIYAGIDYTPDQILPICEIREKVIKIDTLIKDLALIYDKISNEKSSKDSDDSLDNESEKKRGKMRHAASQKRVQLYEYDDAEREFLEYVDCPTVRAANEGVLFLKGEPGMGKSHFLADIALEARSKDLPPIFLLGEHFPAGSPKIYIQQSLIPAGKIEDYLKALESIGRSKNERILFIIDAINEGIGKRSWKSHLKGLAEEFKVFKWIGFVISYRTTYEKVVMPEEFTPPLINHTGFEENNYEAVKTFFNYYKITQPSIPLLNPEFSNPLFLKTFCLTLNKAGHRTVPGGYMGISLIFSDFVKAVNKNIGEKLIYPHDKINLVDKAIKGLIKYQIENGESTVPWEIAHQIREPLLKQYTSSDGLLGEMVAEGLLMEDVIYDFENNLSVEGVLFNYERFNEHQRALYHLDTVETVEALKKLFVSGGVLRKVFFDRHGFHGIEPGLLNALAIIIPEKFKVEIFSVFRPRDEDATFAILEAVLYSLIWRKKETFNVETWKYIQANINEYTVRTFYNNILLLSAVPGHFFNANFLHGLLIDLPVARRDLKWTVPVDQFWSGSDSSPRRIIDWCWSIEDRNFLENESVLLLGRVLAWFFTSSNRALRDQSTKALGSFFSNRLSLLQLLIADFKDVNDPYILERLFAGAYGAVTHSSDVLAKVKFAQFIYNNFFSERKPPVNILTREYGKCIVEYVGSLSSVLQFDQSYLKPPFVSIFPKIPDQSWLEEMQTTNTDIDPRDNYSHKWIFTSVLNWDFARYILGTNSGSSIPFTASTIDERVSYENLKQKLKGKKKAIFEACELYSQFENEKSTVGKNVRKYFNGERLDEFLAMGVKGFEAEKLKLREKLKGEELKMFEKALPYMNHVFIDRNYDRQRFDVKVVQRYILWRVFDLGWTTEFFGRFDNGLSERDRKANKPERIGKKYQWIAYYEIMAFLSDHFDFLNRFSDQQTEYLGTWQHNFRNIDPSNLVRPRKKSISQEIPWWRSEGYSNWNEERDIWLNHLNDFPDVSKIVLRKDDKGDECYMLYDRIIWKSPVPIGSSEHFGPDRREFWIDINAFLVSKEDKQIMMEKASQDIFWVGDDVPENPNFYDVFIGEFYHSKTYDHHIKGFLEDYPYTNITLGDTQIKAYHTTEDYSFGSEYDMSGEKAGMYKPSKKLMEIFDGVGGKDDYATYNALGKIIALDPGAADDYDDRCLLINKEWLDVQLASSNLELVWFFCGEKEDIGAGIAYVFRLKFSGATSMSENGFIVKYFHEREV